MKNAFYPKCYKLSGRDIEDKLIQFENVLLFMFIIDYGKFIYFKLMHPANAPTSLYSPSSPANSSTVSGIKTFTIYYLFL